MSLCSNCVLKLIDKLAPNDIYLLHKLQEKITAQLGESRTELYSELKDVMSMFQLQQAIMRMELLGFIGTRKYGKTMHYYITDSGLLVLDILSKK